MIIVLSWSAARVQLGLWLRHWSYRLRLSLLCNSFSPVLLVHTSPFG